MHAFWLRLGQPIVLLSLGIVLAANSPVTSPSDGCPSGTVPFKCPGMSTYGCGTPGSIVSCPDGTRIVLSKPTQAPQTLPTPSVTATQPASFISPEAIAVLKGLLATYQRVRALKSVEIAEQTGFLPSLGNLSGQVKTEFLYRSPLYFRVRDKLLKASVQATMPKTAFGVFSFSEWCDGTSLYTHRSDDPKVYFERPLSKDEKAHSALGDIMHRDDLLIKLLAGISNSEQNIQKFLIAMGEWEQGATPDPSAWRISSLQVFPSKPQSDTSLITLEAQISGAPTYGTSTISIWVKPLGKNLYQLIGYRIHLWDDILVRTVTYESTLYWQSSDLPLSLFHCTLPKGAIRKVLPAEESGG